MFGEKIIMNQLFPFAFIPRPPENYCDENTYLSRLNKLNFFLLPSHIYSKLNLFQNNIFGGFQTCMFAKLTRIKGTEHMGS